MALMKAMCAYSALLSLPGHFHTAWMNTLYCQWFSLRECYFYFLHLIQKNVFSHRMQGKKRRSNFQNNTPLLSPVLDVAQIIKPYRKLSLSDTRPDLSTMLWHQTLPAESFSLRPLNAASVLGGDLREVEWWIVSKISPGAPNGNQSNGCSLRYCPGML